MAGDPFAEDEVTTPKFTPPEIFYGPDGAAYIWQPPLHPGGLPRQVRMAQFDDPTKASGYRAPQAPRAPSQASTFIDARTGEMVGVDPVTGQERFRIPGAAYASLTPQEQRALDIADAESARRFEQDILRRQQEFSAAEADKSRQFNASESALDRAIRSADLATSINFQNQANAFAAEQDFQNRMRQFTQDKLGAAQQVADNISNVDPGALGAFYEAGGGVIANALRNGGTARSDLSDFGSAAALRASEEMVTPTKYSFTPVSFDPSQFYQPPQQPTSVSADSGGLMAETPQQVAQRRLDEASSVGRNTTGWTANESGQFVGPNPFATPRFATGTMGDIPAPKQFISGDAMGADPAAGGARPELVTVDDPEGNARLSVDPMVPPGGGGEHKAGAFLRAVADFIDEPITGGGGMPRFATGTGMFSGTDPINITDADRPYLDRIGAVRDNVQFPDLNPFDVQFALNAPSQIDRFFRGRQTKYAVPVEDQAAEASRFALSGANRGGLALGV